ncbi:Dimeric alpha-beta barrel [Corchorus capsularis]|uniref:Dimeric alpha-beta barrel n=1 Tax=Corchorus capsularis TaxID=210143 RepID=A0A1R3IKE2_COCAP|nr:Dimeric alpha-beta barrel [Corchorus capsularis]
MVPALLSLPQAQTLRSLHIYSAISTNVMGSRRATPGAKGQISDQPKEDYTHAVFMRFRSKEDLTKFYENPFYLEVLKEHVEPYCHGLMNVDYESEVEDDILPIFRKGEAFNYGVEFVLLIAFVEDAISGPAENALTSLQELTMDFPSLIVQCTQGSNFNFSCEEYTHGMVIRFRSFEAFEIFLTSSKYRDVRNLKLLI